MRKWLEKYITHFGSSQDILDEFAWKEAKEEESINWQFCDTGTISLKDIFWTLYEAWKPPPCQKKW